jgi:cholesterol oxidase
MNTTQFDYDWLIVGSGFGGSVSALRLAEKGYKVGVLECGNDTATITPRAPGSCVQFLGAPYLGYAAFSNPRSGCIRRERRGSRRGGIVYANACAVRPRRFSPIRNGPASTTGRRRWRRTTPPKSACSV